MCLVMEDNFRRSKLSPEKALFFFAVAVAFYQNVCHLGASVHVVAASLSSVALSPNQVLLLLFSAAEPGLAVGIS